MPLSLRFLAPATLLGVVLLLGERPANPPDEVPSATLSAAADDLAERMIPCPGLVPGRLVVSLLPVRLPPAASALLKADAPAPETRSLSPPAAV